VQSGKTSCPRGWPRTLRGTMGAPAAFTPARLAVENSPQSSTAQAATETLLWHTRPQRKQHIAAGPPTGNPGKILRIGGWALALARRFRLQLHYFRRLCLCRHGFLGHLDFDGPQHFFPAGRSLLPAALAVAAGLLLAALLPPFASPVRLATPPPPPPGGFLLTGWAAKVLMRLSRTERAFTTLQQTEPLSVVATGLLRRPRYRGILKWAHGSNQPAGSSLGDEVVLDSEAFLLAHQVQHSDGSAAELREDLAGKDEWGSNGDRRLAHF
jgi:hypothetical protein